MKATQKDFATVALRAAREARIFYFCGPDEAGIQDAAARITAVSVTRPLRLRPGMS